MSWFAKVGFFSALVCLSTAMAGRVYFPGHHEGQREAMSAQLLSDSRNMSSVDIHFSIPHIDINKMTDGFDKVAAPGLVPLETAGLPELFTTGTLVAVPPGFDIDVKWVSQDVSEITDVVAQPAQSKYRCNCDENNRFQYDAAAYKSATVYPAKQLVVEEVSNIQGVRLVRVGFFPAQYDFAKKLLKVTHTADFKVTFHQVADSIVKTRLTKANFSMLRSIAANGQSLTGELVAMQQQDVLLVISADSLMETMAPFVNWKRSKGIKVDMVSFTTAGGTKEKVKAYIKNYYDTQTMKPSYLLFVGNKDTMPGYMESTKAGSAATDFTYAIVKTDDKIPSIPYGRFLANNAAELKVVMNRSIEYERSPEKAADWYANGTTIASDEGYNPSDKEYAQQIAAALKGGTYKNVDGFYQGDDNATVENITNALKDGRTWVSYFGHGSGTSWGSTNEDFSNTEVAKLNNSGRLPVIIDVACQNGSWVKLEKPFAKAWVQQQMDGKDAGAVAFYGGSVNISWHPPAIMSVGIAKSHFEKPVYHLGGTVLAGQMHLIKEKGMIEDTLDNFKWYNLFGDPSLQIRTSMPLAYDVKSSVVTKDGNTVLTVKATDMSGKPMAGVMASLSMKGAPSLAVGTTNAGGTAELVVTAMPKLEPGTLLTTSGYNLETHEVAM